MTMSSLAAAIADRYDIERELGRGGMATVYLARDRKHDRAVAIKVLNPELGAMLGAERFLAEIKTTATLQHPNLLPLFDSGEANGLLYYVMPYLEGETLRARLQREQQLPIDDAVRIATGIAHALSYAHARNVVHRDLKPENVLLQHGQPVVLDFGIALAMRNAGGTRMTQTGVSIGTPQYMSPEQAAGERQIDARTDLFALGALLYEMLAGETPHAGPTAQIVIAKVMSGEAPPVTRMRPSVPPYIANAVHQALSRLPADRFANADEFIRALQAPDAATTLTRGSGEHTDDVARANRVKRVYAIIATASVLAAGGTIALTRTPAPAVSNPAVRFVLETPPSEALAPSNALRTIAVSPDGAEVVYRGVSPEGVVLYRRRLDELTATAVSGTRGALSVLYAPDGGSLLIGRDGTTALVPLAGGEPITTPVRATAPPTWDEQERQTYTDARGIWQSSPNGSKPTLLIANDGSGALYFNPHLLPGGTALVAVRADPKDVVNAPEIVAIRLSDGKPLDLGMRGFDARYVSAGYLLVSGGSGSLSAVPFDASSLTSTGEPQPVLRDISGDQASRWAVSKNGVLAYLERSKPKLIASADRAGTEHILFDATSNIAHLRASPRGDQVAYEAEGANGGTDVYVVSRSTKVTTRISRDGRSRSPEWSSDGARLYWIVEDSARTNDARDIKLMGAASRLMSQPVDGSAPPTRVTTPPGALHAFSLSPDGKHIAISVGASARHRLVISTLNSDSAIATIGDGVSDLVQSVFSPDGKWLAYTSNEIGRYEVSVTAVDQPLSPLQISTNGGNSPIWSSKGNTLYYSSTTHMLGVTIAFAPRPSPRAIDTLFLNVYRSGSRDREIDIDPKTNEFIVRSTGGQSGERIIVVTGWFDDLRRRFQKK